MRRELPTAAAAACLLIAASLAAAAPRSAPRKPPAKAPLAKPAALRPADVLARLAKDEGAVKSGRLSILALHRRAELPEGTRPAAARELAARAPLFSQKREYFLFSGEQWRRDSTLMDPQGNTGSHEISGSAGGIGRFFRETGHGEQAERRGEVGAVPEQNAADRLLMSRGAGLVQGVSWSAARSGASAKQVVLTGTRGGEKYTLTVRTAPRYQVERLSVSEPVETPLGPATRGQELVVRYDPKPPGLAVLSLEHVIYAVGAVNQAAVTLYKIEGALVNSSPPRPDELAVVFPAGIQVTDGRVEPPVRYTQGERDLTTAEVRALAQKRADSVARVGGPAPEWELRGLDGKTVRLSDYRGRVVILTWFASWCGPCAAEAPVMEKEIWQKYRARGLTVVGVNAGERMDPEKMARQFADTHGLTYPVVLDTEMEAGEMYRVRVLPTLAVIDRRGALKYLQAGFDRDAVVAQVEALLAEP